MTVLRRLLGLGDPAPPPRPERCAESPSDSERRYERARRGAEGTIRHADRETERVRRQALSWDELLKQGGSGRG